MPKQTKTIKFMIALLLLIPIVLFMVGIVQTFVLKSKQNELANSKYNLEQSQTKQEELSNEYDYKTSDEYLKEHYKHNSYDGKYYGDDGDVLLEKEN